ncbi:MAG: hypothetical protein WBO55_08180 [Rhizobiaceae bacterium]
MAKHARRHNENDPDEELDRAAIAEWFPSWRARFSSHSDAVRAINKTVSEILGDQKDRPDYPIGDAQSFTNWQNGAGVRATYRPWSCLFAFFQATGIDVTKKRLFSDAELNFTRIAKISKLQVQQLSNAPADDGSIVFRIELPLLTFRDRSRTVTAKLFGHTKQSEKKDGVSPEKTIGTVQYAVLNAILSVEAEGDFEPGFRRLRSGESAEFGYSEGCEVFKDHTRQVAWTVSKSANDIWLWGDLGQLDLGRLRTSENAVIDFKVLAEDRSSIATSFKVAPAFEKNEPLARSQLISQVLAQRWGGREEHVLCFHRIEVEC